MNCFKKLILSSALITLAGTAFATPDFLVTVNDSNHGKVYAKIGRVKSGEPVLAHNTRNRKWQEVKFLCSIQAMPKTCVAEILVEHDVSGQFESLGNMSMNLDSGELTPKTLSSAHYTMNVTGNAHVEVTSSSNDF